MNKFYDSVMWRVRASIAILWWFLNGASVKNQPFPQYKGWLRRRLIVQSSWKLWKAIYMSKYVDKQKLDEFIDSL